MSSTLGHTHHALSYEGKRMGILRTCSQLLESDLQLHYQLFPKVGKEHYAFKLVVSVTKLAILKVHLTPQFFFC